MARPQRVDVEYPPSRKSPPRALKLATFVAWSTFSAVLPIGSTLTFEPHARVFRLLGRRIPSAFNSLFFPIGLLGKLTALDLVLIVTLLVSIWLTATWLRNRSANNGTFESYVS